MYSTFIFPFVPCNLFSLIGSTIYCFVPKIMTYITISREKTLVHDRMLWCCSLDWLLSLVIPDIMFFMLIFRLCYYPSACWMLPCILGVIILWVIPLFIWTSKSIYVTLVFVLNCLGAWTFVNRFWIKSSTTFVKVRSLTIDNFFKDLTAILLFILVLKFHPCYCYLCFQSLNDLILYL